MMQYPVKHKKPDRRMEYKTVLILRDQGRTAVRKRSAQGVLSGMWELPNIDGVMTKQQIMQWLADREMDVIELAEITHDRLQLKHVFTHIEWHMTCWLAVCTATSEDSGLTWVTQEQLEQEIALPTAFKKCLKMFEKDIRGRQSNDK